MAFHLNLLWLSLFVLTCPVGAQTYSFDQDHARLEFTVQHFFGKVNGRFHRFHGTLYFNPQDPEKSEVSAAVDLASIDTANADRDAHLRSAEFFDVARYPTAVFKSTSVHRTGDAEAQVTGNLTLHGVTRPLALSVRRLILPGEPASPRVTRWQANAEVKRADFGLMWGPVIEASQAVGRVVSLQISVEAFRS